MAKLSEVYKFKIFIYFLTYLVPKEFGVVDIRAQEIWALRNLGPEKFGPEKFGASMEVIIFMKGSNFLGPKFLRV